MDILGTKKVSLLERCSDFRGCKYMTTNKVFGTTECVVFSKVSTFHGIEVREFPLCTVKYSTGSDEW